MTKNEPRLKKLSTAMRRGYLIAKERGIKVSRGEFIRENKKGEIVCACALGIAAIGLYGINNSKSKIISDVLEHFGLYGISNKCLVYAIKPKSEIPINWYYWSIQNCIVNANDTKKWNPDKIAEKLESCKL